MGMGWDRMYGIIYVPSVVEQNRAGVGVVHIALHLALVSLFQPSSHNSNSCYCERKPWGIVLFSYIIVYRRQSHSESGPGTPKSASPVAAQSPLPPSTNVKVIRKSRQQ